MHPERIDPFRVRFSQNSIKARFKSGSTVAELAEALRLGVVRHHTQTEG